MPLLSQKQPSSRVVLYFMRYTIAMRFKVYIEWKIELALKYFKRWLDSLE